MKKELKKSNSATRISKTAKMIASRCLMSWSVQMKLVSRIRIQTFKILLHIILTISWAVIILIYSLNHKKERNRNCKSIKIVNSLVVQEIRLILLTRWRIVRKKLYWEERKQEIIKISLVNRQWDNCFSKRRQFNLKIFRMIWKTEKMLMRRKLKKRIKIRIPYIRITCLRDNKIIR